MDELLHIRRKFGRQIQNLRRRLPVRHYNDRLSETDSGTCEHFPDSSRRPGRRLNPACAYLSRRQVRTGRAKTDDLGAGGLDADGLDIGIRQNNPQRLFFTVGFHGLTRKD